MAFTCFPFTTHRCGVIRFFRICCALFVRAGIEIGWGFSEHLGRSLLPEQEILQSGDAVQHGVHRKLVFLLHNDPALQSD